MLAYKFLDADGCAPFTGARWRPGEWVEAASAAPCVVGVHACRASDVSYWIAASMWRIELDGGIVSTSRKVVGRRGRLIGPVDGYDEAMHELRELSAWRSRERAVAALRGVDDGLAGDLAAASTLADLEALAARCDEATFGGLIAALAADTAQLAASGEHPEAPFVAACSAGHFEAGPGGDQAAFDEGYHAERVFQSTWLTDRLALA